MSQIKKYFWYIWNDNLYNFNLTPKTAIILLNVDSGAWVIVIVDNTFELFDEFELDVDHLFFFNMFFLKL